VGPTADLAVFEKRKTPASGGGGRGESEGGFMYVVLHANEFSCFTLFASVSHSAIRVCATTTVTANTQFEFSFSVSQRRRH
jgi:hypothetical protein